MAITKEDIASYSLEAVRDYIKACGIIRLAQVMGAFWQYDYKAAEEGRFGYHALLKSGLHSDGFFVSRILLEPENVIREVGRMMVERLRTVGVQAPEYVVGIPDGATKLGNVVAELFTSNAVELKKEDGHMMLHTQIRGGASVLIVEDICTRGTGFSEGVAQIRLNSPMAKLLLFDPVIINRGGLKYVIVPGVGAFEVIPLVDKRIQDWAPEECPLCKMGSQPIKPKATDENWQLLTTSQLP